MDSKATATDSAIGKEGLYPEPENNAMTVSNLEAKAEDTEIRARVDSMWEQMKKGISNKELNCLINRPNYAKKKTPKKTSSNWMTYLGLAPKATGCPTQDASQKAPSIMQNGASDEAKRFAAAALAVVKDAAAASARGKLAITEVWDFAGQNVEIKKYVEADSMEALDKAKAPASSAVDAVLEQIKKKPKLSVLDKTKKDWGEFKEEKGLEEELDAYKKSSNQFLEKVSFLQRADYREFERERDARLALQARRRPDMREEP